MRDVLDADASTVTVPGPWLDDVTEFPNRYTDHWVQVVDGKGVGQARKIESYTGGAQSTITVSPPWDVVPDASSKVTVARQFWQVYVVDNQVDIRGCEKDNPNTTKSGVIGFAAMMADSTIEGNTLYESDGILLVAQYIVELADLNVRSFQYFIEVRGNTIIDEYDFDSDHSWSGITLRYASDPDHPSPVVGYGISVSHNTIDHADGLRGGTIGIVLAGNAPPTPYQHKSTLIHHNHISDVMRLDDQGVCLPDNPVARNGGVGIHIHKAFTWDTVLYANTTKEVCHDLVNEGTNTWPVPSLPMPGSFLCYKIKASKLTPSPVASLTDPFETGMFGVKRAMDLCTPADVNNGRILDPDTHLVGYQLTRGPRHKRQNVRVANQLGDSTLQTRKADSLLVPSAEDLASEPLLPDPARHHVGHYKCYTANKAMGFVPQSVRVADQFTPLPGKIVDVKRLTKLCTPADKNGEGIKNPETYLTCYQVQTHPEVRESEVQINNWFGPGTVDIRGEKELCMPSTVSAVTVP